MTETSARPENEFADLATRPEAPQVQRRWFTASDGGHVSGVVWGVGTPAAVVVPDDTTPARELDAVALDVGVPIVVLDRPGLGRSSGPATSAARSGRVLAEAVWSFAPRRPVIVGLGPDGATAALATAARSRSVSHVVLVGAPLTDDHAAVLELLSGKSVPVEPLDDVDPGDLHAVAAALRPRLTATSSAEDSPTPAPTPKEK